MTDRKDYLRQLAKRRGTILGMSWSNALHRLRKLTLFKVLVETGRNICYRCGKPITEPDDLTLDHKEQWLAAPDPKEAFFDTENIAFSHDRCNKQNNGRLKLRSSADRAAVS